MTRLIHYSNDSGSKEGVYFTEDTELNASSVVPPGCTITNDVILDEEFPSTFPMDYNLEKK